MDKNFKPLALIDDVKVLRKCMKHKNWRVRRAVALNQYTTDEMLKFLSNDKHPDVANTTKLKLKDRKLVLIYTDNEPYTMTDEFWDLIYINRPYSQHCEKGLTLEERIK